MAVETAFHSRAPGSAIRQFGICLAELSRELNRARHRETIARYEEIRFGPVQPRRASA